MKLERIARKTLADEVFEQLSSQIVQGRMKPGIALPPERELVAMLGVNRGAIREALQRMAQAGLVSIQQGGGTRVLDFRRSGALNLLGRLMFSDDGSVDLRVARSVMEMRAALAPDIARLCAARRSDETLEELEHVIEQMQAAHDDPEALQVLSLQLWDALVRGSGNIAYELAFNTLRETYEDLRGALVQVLADEVRDVAGHRAIVQAVRRRDQSAAREAAAAVVERGTTRVMGLIAVLEGDDEDEDEKDGETT